MIWAEGSLPSRAAALGVLAVLLGLFYVGPIAAYAGLVRAEGQKVADAEAALARGHRLIRQGRGTAPALRSILFADMSDAQAAALLQESLKAAAASAHVEIGGLQVLPAEPAQGSRRIGVRLRARGDMAGIERFLYAIEAARPVLYPDNLLIQSRTAPGAAPSVLDFEIEVAGFASGAS